MRRTLATLGTTAMFGALFLFATSSADAAVVASLPAAAARTCADFPFQQDAQLVLEADPTDSGLDADRDGVACEDLPRRSSVRAAAVGYGTERGSGATAASGAPLARTGGSPASRASWGVGAVMIGVLIAAISKRFLQERFDVSVLPRHRRR